MNALRAVTLTLIIDYHLGRARTHTRTHAHTHTRTHGACGQMSRPNILLLMPDQWRWDWDGMSHAHAHAPPPLRLPNIQALRELGTTFLGGAVVASPVCAPSRSCLASLREYDHAGTATNNANDYKAEEIPTYFSVLQRAGYHTMSTGKDDLTKASQLGYAGGYDTRNASDTYHAKLLGFSDSIRFSGKLDVVEGKFPMPHEPYGYHLAASSVRLANGSNISAWRAHRACFGIGDESHLCESATFPQELYEDDWTAKQAVKLLRRAPRHKPWFMWVSFPGPHPPFAVTASMARRVARRTWPPPVDPGLRPPPLCEPDVASGHPSHMRTRCNYAAEAENLDRLFGVIIDAARARGDGPGRNNTVVCFFSDHGEMLNDHGVTDKSKPWQGALNVPLVCAGPGIRANASVDRVPIAAVDIGATVLDLAGAWELRERGMTAVSFRGLLEGNDTRSLNRTVVHSGLQSVDFVDRPLQEAAEGRGGSVPPRDMVAAASDESFNFRLAVSVVDGPPRSIYKFVCCQGRCPGAPSNVGPPDEDGYTRLLYDTLADPFDMHDLRQALPHVTEVLRRELPVVHGFDCREQS